MLGNFFLTSKACWNVSTVSLGICLPPVSAMYGNDLNETFSDTDSFAHFGVFVKFILLGILLVFC